MTALEKEILLSVDYCQVQILDNHQGRQSFEGRSLFFMPHCPRQLYENVLWAHYNQLNRIVILGNSLLNYVDALHGKNDTTLNVNSSSCPCLKAIIPFVREVPLQLEDVEKTKASGNLEGAFNDTYWTTFHVDDESAASLLVRPIQQDREDPELL
jgi:hypothetical protein